MERVGAGVARRLFDIVASAAALVALSPLLAAIAVVVKASSPGPALFRQARLGKDERLFQIYKFRTMVAGAESGSPITVNGDRRITRVGRVLRRFDLDELPTLFNVLRGDMTIVGPRPELPVYLPNYSREQRRVFSVRPGLTDPATLAFRDESRQLNGASVEEVYIHEILPQKLALNLAYLKARSVRSDAAIMLRTVAAMLFRPKS